jgi:hypothetical protein
MNRTTCLAVSLFSCLGLLLAAGCGDSGPELGTVAGTVTLDGKPVPKATLEFQPGPGGSPSYGTTDENGHFEMLYALGKPGALVGEHVVRITTEREEAADADGTAPPIEHPEILHANYHVDTVLTAKVEPGPQTIDWPLTADGQKPKTGP